MKLILEGTPAEIGAWQAEQAKRFHKDLLLDVNLIARNTIGHGGQGNYYCHGGTGGCDDENASVGVQGYIGNTGKRGTCRLCSYCGGHNLNWNSKNDICTCLDCGKTN